MYIEENMRFITDNVRNLKTILNLLINPLIEFFPDL